MKPNNPDLKKLQRSGSIGNILKSDTTSFYKVPESPASNLIMETLSAGSSISDLPQRKKQVNKKQCVDVYESGQKRQVILSNQHSEIEIEISDIDKLVGSNKPAKKIFVLTLIKANEQAIHNRQLTKNSITFPLQELIDIGFYSSLNNARRGFKLGMDTLTSLKIKGKTRLSAKKEDTIESLRVLFTGYDIIKGQCFIYLNDTINWGFIAQYFTILPQYYFKLSNKASDLLFYIFYIARQRVKDISEKGYFTIGFKAIQHRLNLPNEKQCLNPGRDIKDVIEAAITEIEDMNLLYYKDYKFTLTLVYNENANIADFLNNGFLKVEMGDIFAQTFVELNDTKVKAITAAQKRKEKIIDTAKAKKLAKKMEQEDT